MWVKDVYFTKCLISYGVEITQKIQRGTLHYW